MTEPLALPFHGGGLDATVARFGGHRENRIDLSTGINPIPVPGQSPSFSPECWTSHPDKDVSDRLIEADRRHWELPRQNDVVLVPGVSSPIAKLPFIEQPRTVIIRLPTYGEFAFAFANAG